MSNFEVEIAFALPERQLLETVSVTAGETVLDVITKSGLQEAFPEYEIDRLAVGIWGHEVRHDRVVKENDRIEIYRPLQLDPREARRQLALSGRTMAGRTRGSADSD